MYDKIWCVILVLYELYNCVGGPNSTTTPINIATSVKVLISQITLTYIVRLF